jgi:hypothetical protein
LHAQVWTSILTSIGTQATESEGIFNDIATRFRSHRNISDSLSTHIMMYEDIKISKRNIYTAYSDFKGFMPFKQAMAPSTAKSYTNLEL